MKDTFKFDQHRRRWVNDKFVIYKSATYKWHLCHKDEDGCDGELVKTFFDVNEAKQHAYQLQQPTA